MKLNNVEIENFRSIKTLTVPLHSQLTVLVGDNAAGKTTILDAIAIGLSPLVSRLIGYTKNKPSQPSIKASDYRQAEYKSRYIPGKIDIEYASFVRITINAANSTYWTVDDGEINVTKAKDLFSIFNTELDNYVSYVNSKEGDNLRARPVIAYYGVSRGSLYVKRKKDAVNTKDASRHSALIDALESKTIFENAVAWFEMLENLELREQRERQDFSFRLPQLEVIRRAVASMLPKLENPRMVGIPPRLIVDFHAPDGRVGPLELEQLSGGYRLMLALVMDLARRMALGNPHLPDPLQSEAIVMIDEVDLHLHPVWQQTVLPDLLRTFPNTQFIVTTHSPQVLSTVQPENILLLQWSGDELQLAQPNSSYGAESGRLLTEILGVEQRPPAEDNLFVQKLDEYRELVKQERWDTPEAEALRLELRAMSPQDPAVSTLDLEMRRLQALRGRTQRK